MGLESFTPGGTLGCASAKSSNSFKKYVVTLVGERADLINRLAASHAQVLKLSQNVDELQVLSDMIMSFLTELIFIAKNGNSKLELSQSIAKLFDKTKIENNLRKQDATEE